MGNRAKKMYILFFTVVVFLPLALFPFLFTISEKNVIEMDKHYPTKFSDVIDSENKTQAFENWFADHIAFRKTAISLWSKANLSIGVSNKPLTVLLGENDWMFLGNQYNAKSTRTEGL